MGMVIYTVRFWDDSGEESLPDADDVADALAHIADSCEFDVDSGESESESRANDRKRELAESIVALNGALEVRETGKPVRAVWDYADELAKLVLAS